MEYWECGAGEWGAGEGDDDLAELVWVCYSVGIQSGGAGDGSGALHVCGECGAEGRWLCDLFSVPF